MNDLIVKYYKRAAQVNPSFEMTNGRLFVPVKKTVKVNLTKKEIGIAFGITAAILMFSLYPPMMGLVDYVKHIRPSIIIVESAESSALDFIDANKEILSVETNVLASSDFVNQNQSRDPFANVLNFNKKQKLNNKKITFAEDFTLKIKDIASRCETDLKDRVREPDAIATDCREALGMIQNQAKQKVESLKNYEANKKMADAAKVKINEIYDRLINNLDTAARNSAQFVSYGNEANELLKKYSKNGYVRIGDLQQIDRLTLNAESTLKLNGELEKIISSANRDVSKMIGETETPILKERGIKDNLSPSPSGNAEIISHEQQRLSDVHGEAIKLQEQYDDKRVVIDQLLKSSAVNPMAQQRVSSKLGQVERINASKPTCTDDSSCSVIADKLNKMKGNLEQALKQLESAENYLNKNKK